MYLLLKMVVFHCYVSLAKKIITHKYPHYIGLQQKKHPIRGPRWGWDRGTSNLLPARMRAAGPPGPTLPAPGLEGRNVPLRNAIMQWRRPELMAMENHKFLIWKITIFIHVLKGDTSSNACSFHCRFGFWGCFLFEDTVETDMQQPKVIL